MKGFHLITVSISVCRYLDNKVFVSLANGEMIVYQREAGEETRSDQSLTGGCPRPGYIRSEFIFHKAGPTATSEAFREATKKYLRLKDS